MALYANQWGPEALIYSTGGRIALTAVSVLKASDHSLAALYTDKTKAIEAENPTMTDSLGNLRFWANPDEYLIAISNVEVLVTLPLHPDEPSSGGGGDDAIVYTQSVPASSWTINHNKGRLPVVELWMGGEQVFADIEATTTQATLTFPVPSVGTVVIK